MSEEEEVIEIIDTDIPLTEHHPTWLINLYTQLWDKSQHNLLTMSEIMSRSIDPESPRWYMLPIKEQNFGTRIRCWATIRKVHFSTN